MRIDAHAAVLALREAYHRYRPHAVNHGDAEGLDIAQQLLETLPPETLTLAPVQRAVSKLVPVKDDHAFRYRGRVMTYLTLLGVPLAKEVYDGLYSAAS